MKPILSFAALALFILTLFPAVAIAAEPADEAKTGLAVGQRAPGFSLKDQQGQERTLEGLLEAGPVALVFTRSADW